MNAEIKVVSSTEIRFLDSGSYESLYNSTMRKALGLEMCSLFAPIKIESKKVVWYLPNNVKGKFKSIVDAPNDQRGLLYILWEEKKAQITELLNTKKTLGTLSKILTIPYDSFIFYCENPGAEHDIPARRFTLLITGWACEKGAKTNQGQDVAKSDIVQAGNVHQNVNVFVINDKGLPIANSSFTYLYNGERKCMSDSNGDIAFSLCKVGAQIRLRYDLTGQERSFEVLKNVENYELQFSPFVSARICVVDQHGRQVSNVRLKLTYANQIWDLVTDGLGVLELPEILYQGERVMLHAQALDYGVSKDFQIFTESNRNGGNIEVFVKDPIQVRLRVFSEDKPLSGYSVQIDCKGDTRVVITDNNGIISLPYIHEGDYFKATSQEKPDIQRSFLVNENQEEYVFVIPAEKPIDPPSEEPLTQPYILVVVDGKPAMDFELKVEKAGFSKILKSDGEGKIMLEGMNDHELFIAMTVGEPKIYCSYTYEKSQYEYLFEVITPETQHNYHLLVKVNDVPEPNFGIHIEKAGESFDAETNEFGIIELDTVKAGDFILASSIEDPSHRESYTITEDVEEYLFLIKKSEPEQNFIKVIDAEDNPVPFFEIQVKHNGIVEHVVSDSQGLWLMPKDWKTGELVEVTDSKNTVSEVFQLVEDQHEYVLKLPAEVPSQYAHIRVINSKGAPCPNYPLSLQVEDRVQQVVTDVNGMYELGELPVGTKFIVADGKNSSVQQQYEVLVGKDEYIFQIQEELNPVVVQLLDKDEKPVPNAQLNLKNQAGAEFSHYTNEEGCIEVPLTFFADTDKVRVHTVLNNTNVKDCKFNYQRQYDHYIIRLKDPFPWGCLWRILLALLLIALLFVRCERDITVHTLAIDDTPISGAVVQLEYTEHQLYKNGEFFYNHDSVETMSTDSIGDASFRINISVFGWIFYSFAKANVSGYKDTMSGQGEFLYHWLFGKYNLYLTGTGLIRVADAITGTPIAKAQVKLTDPELPGDSLVLITDQQGVCSFNIPASNDGIDRILASASGYSGSLLKDVPYKSIADSGLLILLEPPLHCNTEVNNSDGTQGNHAVYDFYLGKGGRSFQLDFFTDSAPDHIMVYDGTSSDYSNGTAKLIFNYFDATNTTTYTPEFSTVLQFSGEYICIVVDEGTNWGYYVHCPQ